MSVMFGEMSKQSDTSVVVRFHVGLDMAVVLGRIALESHWLHQRSS
jgi:hypothetical protein